MYELDLALRNNITTEEHPLGVYHPHEKLHHIKKENIGLIEVMGLAVLPSRLKDELEELAEWLGGRTPAAGKGKNSKNNECGEGLKKKGRAAGRGRGESTGGVGSLKKKRA